MVKYIMIRLVVLMASFSVYAADGDVNGADCAQKVGVVSEGALPADPSEGSREYTATGQTQKCYKNAYGVEVCHDVQDSPAPE